MITVSAATKTACKTESVERTLTISVGEQTYQYFYPGVFHAGESHAGGLAIVTTVGSYSDSDVVYGTISLTQSICSGEQLDFTSVEKDCLKFTLASYAGEISDLMGKTITISQTVNGEEIPLGSYIVVDAPNVEDTSIEVTAYDYLQKLDTDVAAWWNGLPEGLTHREVLTSLCEYCLLDCEIDETYCNSDVIIQKSSIYDAISGIEILGYLQAITGAFYKVSRTDNILRRVDLTGESVETFDTPLIVSGVQIADYTTEAYATVVIRATENDVGVTSGTGEAPYIVQANPLLGGYGTDDLQPIADALLTEISGFSYRPFEAEVVGLPYLEAGDVITLTTYGGSTATAPLLNYTLSNTRLYFANISVKGTEKTDAVLAAGRNVRILNQKYHELVNTIEELRSEILDGSTAIGVMVESVTVSYLQNTGTIPSLLDAGWQETIPERIEGYVLWMKYTYAYTNGLSTEAGPIDISDIAGSEGGTLTAITPQYYQTASATDIGTVDETAIVEIAPEYVAGTYVWTRMKYTFSDDTVSYTDWQLASELNALWTAINENKTQIEQNAQGIALNASTITTTSDNLTDYVNEQISQLQVTIGEIQSTVTTWQTQMQESDDELAELISGLQSQISQTSSQIEMLIQQTDEQGDWITAASAWLTAEGLFVSTSDTSTQTNIDGSGIKIMKPDGTIIAQFNNENSFVDYLKVNTFLAFGGHRAEKYTMNEWDGTSTVGTAYFWTGGVS